MPAIGLSGPNTRRTPRGVVCPVIETTALGAAYLAGLHTGLFAGLDELSKQWRAERTFHPTLSREHAAEKMAQWEHAVRQTVL